MDFDDGRGTLFRDVTVIDGGPGLGRVRGAHAHIDGVTRTRGIASPGGQYFSPDRIEAVWSEGNGTRSWSAVVFGRCQYTDTPSRVTYTVADVGWRPTGPREAYTMKDMSRWPRFVAAFLVEFQPDWWVETVDNT